MGFGNRDANVLWFGISKGKFTRGKKPDQQEYDCLDGRLKEVSFRDNDFEGKKFREVVIVLDDGEMQVKFSTDVAKGYAQQILKKLPNCDLSQPMEISLSYEETETSKNAGAFIKQGSTHIKQKWTAEHPGDLPPVRNVTDARGNTSRSVDDLIARDQWLEAWIVENISKKLSGQSATSNDQPSGEDEPF